MCHTILLMQPIAYWGSRTYLEYESIDDCMESVCRIFEGYMRCQHLNVESSNYILELFNFLDGLQDITCIVYQEASQTYAPHNKVWIKEQLFLRLDVNEYDYN